MGSPIRIGSFLMSLKTPASFLFLWTLKSSTDLCIEKNLLFVILSRWFPVIWKRKYQVLFLFWEFLDWASYQKWSLNSFVGTLVLMISSFPIFIQREILWFHEHVWAELPPEGPPLGEPINDRFFVRGTQDLQRSI